VRGWSSGNPKDSFVIKAKPVEGRVMRKAEHGVEQVGPRGCRLKPVQHLAIGLSPARVVIFMAGRVEVRVDLLIGHPLPPYPAGEAADFII